MPPNLQNWRKLYKCIKAAQEDLDTLGLLSSAKARKAELETAPSQAPQGIPPMPSPIPEIPMAEMPTRPVPALAEGPKPVEEPKLVGVDLEVSDVENRETHAVDQPTPPAVHSQEESPVAATEEVGKPKEKAATRVTLKVEKTTSGSTISGSQPRRSSAKKESFSGTL